MCTLVQKQLRDSHKDISRNLADKSRKLQACTCEFDLHASHARHGVTRASHESNSDEPIAKSWKTFFFTIQKSSLFHLSVPRL